MLAMGTFQQAGTNLSWLWYVIIGLIILALMAWWLFRRVNGMQRSALAEPPTTPRKDTREDDLKKIEGIGPKVEQILKQAGIRSYESLSAADPAEVQNVLKEAGLQMMNPEGWIEQADLAAKGNWDKLQKLQDELKGGRRT
jgi:hypothetical protein